MVENSSIYVLDIIGSHLRIHMTGMLHTKSINQVRHGELQGHSHDSNQRGILSLMWYQMREEDQSQDTMTHEGNHQKFRNKILKIRCRTRKYNST